MEPPLSEQVFQGPSQSGKREKLPNKNSLSITKYPRCVFRLLLPLPLTGGSRNTRVVPAHEGVSARPLQRAQSIMFAAQLGLDNDTRPESTTPEPRINH